jgi:signal transduction histidine kinase
MTLKQLYISRSMEPAKNPAKGRNKGSNSHDKPTLINHAEITTGNHLMMRLQELEESNANLENIVEQRTNELKKVIETNHKFISILAHDLRSPVSLIITVLELLKKKLNENKINGVEKYINLVSSSASVSLNLLDDLLTWAISQNDERAFNPIKIDLHKLLLSEKESINPLAIQKQITVNYNIETGLNVSADLQMVRTILRNLIGNAIKFTKPSGEITIKASENNQFVEIAVKDNGIGISAESQRDLFKIETVHSTMGTNNEKGTGLGLLLCKEFVEIHGGNIWIESEPCKGSEFKFTLPHYI